MTNDIAKIGDKDLMKTVEYNSNENNDDDDAIRFRHWRGPKCLDAFQGKKAAISWTGGKDCHLALFRAQQQQIEVVCLIMFCTPDKPFQAHRMEWQQQQAKALQLPLVHCLLDLKAATNPDNNQGQVVDYKAAYAQALRKLHQDYPIDILITGDIDYIRIPVPTCHAFAKPQQQTNFMQSVVTEQDCCGIKVLLPLWQQPRTRLLQEMLDHNFDIRFCCVKSPWFDDSFIGRQLHHDTLQELKDIASQSTTFDLNGENGEYHTMVVNGPMYAKNGRGLQFVGVTAQELSHQPGQRAVGDRWWVMSETTQLVVSIQ